MSSNSLQYHLLWTSSIVVIFSILGNSVCIASLIYTIGDAIKPTFQRISETTYIFSLRMRAGSADAITKMEQQNNLTKTILSVFVLLLVMFLFRALVLLWSICGKSQCSLYIPCCCGRPAEEIISKLSTLFVCGFSELRLEHITT